MHRILKQIGSLDTKTVMTDTNLNNNNKTYLCFDLGTTRIKSALLDRNGNVVYLDLEEAISYQEGQSFIQRPEEYYEEVVKKIMDYIWKKSSL